MDPVDPASEKSFFAYDRQMRAFHGGGDAHEVQRALGKYRVVLIGLNAITAEAAKNIVLLGFSHIDVVADDGGDGDGTSDVAYSTCRDSFLWAGHRADEGIEQSDVEQVIASLRALGDGHVQVRRLARAELDSDDTLRSYDGIVVGASSLRAAAELEARIDNARQDLLVCAGAGQLALVYANDVLPRVDEKLERSRSCTLLETLDDAHWRSKEALCNGNGEEQIGPALRAKWLSAMAAVADGPCASLDAVREEARARCAAPELCPDEALDEAAQALGTRFGLSAAATIAAAFVSEEVTSRVRARVKVAALRPVPAEGSVPDDERMQVMRDRSATMGFCKRLLFGFLFIDAAAGGAVRIRCRAPKRKL